jgi:hypothetical protein
VAEAFNPAPFDKYAEHPDTAKRLDRDTHQKLKAGLVGTFPASDPPSITQPAQTRHDLKPKSWTQRIAAWFR